MATQQDGTELRVGIAGLGLIGGSLLRRLAADGVQTVAWNRSDGPSTKAGAAGYNVTDDFDKLVGESDIVVICASPEATPILAAKALTRSDALVTDVASIKQQVTEEVADLVEPAVAKRFIPGHPIAGSEQSGWDAGSESLFEKATWALCADPARSPDLESVLSVAAMAELVGSDVIVTTPASHDRAVAISSHLPHALASALSQSGETLEGGVKRALSGGALRDTTRIAAADPELWSAISYANAPAIEQALKSFDLALAPLRTALTSGDKSALTKFFAEGAAQRELLSHDRLEDGDWVEDELARVRKAGFSDRPFTVLRTWADPRMVDPTIEPTSREPNMCYAGVPIQANRSARGIAAACTLRNWLGMWSLRTARTRAEPHLARIECPALVINAHADTGVFPSDARRIHDALASSDKGLCSIDSDHYFTTPGARSEQADLIAAYRSAHAFLCLSEHEGFCVPIVEAFYMQVPVLAYAATAVPAAVRMLGTSAAGTPTKFVRAA